jgi:hypothetical protein
MKKEMLIAGFACLSVIAVAQSTQTSEQTSKTAKTAKEAGSGQATGKTSAHDDWQQQSAAGPRQTNGVRESPSKASSGLRESPSKASIGKTQVAAGDVNGDGRADAAGGSSPQMDVKAPRDSSTGMASGKQAIVSPRDPMTGQASGKRESSAASVSEIVVTKATDKPKVVPADVDGDGHNDAAASAPKDHSSGQMSGKRQHQPVVLKQVESTTPKQ